MNGELCSTLRYIGKLEKFPCDEGWEPWNGSLGFPRANKSCSLAAVVQAVITTTSSVWQNHLTAKTTRLTWTLWVPFINNRKAIYAPEWAFIVFRGTGFYFEMQRNISKCEGLHFFVLRSNFEDFFFFKFTFWCPVKKQKNVEGFFFIFKNFIFIVNTM